jgi:hypothetical protein
MDRPKLRYRRSSEITRAQHDAERAAQRPTDVERKRAAKRAARRADEEDHPEKRRAHEAVYKALRLSLGSPGFLRRPDHCECCETPCKPDGHHPDYSKPLDVEWLCRTCHRIADKET